MRFGQRRPREQRGKRRQSQGERDPEAAGQRAEQDHDEQHGDFEEAHQRAPPLPAMRSLPEKASIASSISAMARTPSPKASVACGRASGTGTSP